MTEEKIREAFMQGYDCSQVVLRTYAAELGITEDEANRVAACFGGGMMMGEVCGVFSGAMMAIGLRYGHSDPDNLLAQKDIMAAKAAQFREKFLAKHGTVRCCPLLGYDVSVPEELQEALDSGRMMDFCPKLALSAIEILKEILS